jgi:hypothetical protein
MTMLKTRASRGQEGFDELGFAKLAEKSQSVPPNILVGVLKIIPNAVTRSI